MKYLKRIDEKVIYNIEDICRDNSIFKSKDDISDYSQTFVDDGFYVASDFRIMIDKRMCSMNFDNSYWFNSSTNKFVYVSVNIIYEFKPLSFNESTDIQEIENSINIYSLMTSNIVEISNKLKTDFDRFDLYVNPSRDAFNISIHIYEKISDDYKI